MHTIAVLDTGALMGLPHLETLDWADALTGSVELVVTKVNFDELNKHKDGGFPAKRARAAAVIRYLWQKLQNPGAAELRPRVTLRADLDHPQLDYAARHLDRNMPDDRIIAHLIVLKE